MSMVLGPDAFSMLRMMRSRPQQQPITINIDMSALRDLWGKQKITEDDESEDPTPMSVNMPRISPS